MRTANLITAMAGVSLFATPLAAGAQDHVQWAPSFAAAMQQAKTANKLVMADFYTDW